MNYSHLLLLIWKVFCLNILNSVSLGLIICNSWYSVNVPNQPLPVLSSTRVRLLGPILAIEAVTAEDAGTYKCAVGNTGGEASAELRLTVATPLHVEVVRSSIEI